MIARGSASRLARTFTTIVTMLVGASGVAAGAPPPKAPAVVPDSAAPPATLIAGDPVRGAALDPVFAYLSVQRLSCTFTEEKKIALLARPLRSTGTIHFDREKGIARATLTPKAQRVVLTKTTLQIRTGKKVEEIPLDKSKDLKAFALIFPSLLRGDRAELERAFDLGLYGSDKDWWALTLSPKTPSLRKLVKRVVIIGRKKVPVSLQIVEASGDTTDTRLAAVLENDQVTDAEITKAFGN